MNSTRPIVKPHRLYHIPSSHDLECPAPNSSPCPVDQFLAHLGWPERRGEDRHAPPRVARAAGKTVHEDHARLRIGMEAHVAFGEQRQYRHTVWLEAMRLKAQHCSAGCFRRQAHQRFKTWS